MRGATPREIWVFDVVDHGTKLASRRVFVNAGTGFPDGMRCDTDGTLWCGFGRGKRNRLFMAGSPSLYSLYVNAQRATLS